MTTSDSGRSDLSDRRAGESRNLAISRAVWESLARGDFESIASYYDADVELDYTGADALDMGVYRGFEKAAGAAMEWMSRFAGYTARAEQLIDVPPDRVIARVREGGVGVTSGAPVEIETWQVATFRDGRIARVQLFLDENDALRAAG